MKIRLKTSFTIQEEEKPSVSERIEEKKEKIIKDRMPA